MGNNIHIIISFLLGFLFINLVLFSNVQAQETTPKTYDLFIYDVNLTRLCENTTTLTANGTFPGPTIYVNKGETIHVNVHNQGIHGITIHWHGILQPRNPWSDGPMNITQCPIRAGSNFTYELIFSREEGTIWYHAHSEWSMATVHGAIVVYPTDGLYPYPTPDGNQTIILASWYKQEVMEMYEAAKANNYVFPNADGTTINGQPGYPNNCSNALSFRMTVESGKTYLLRVINAVLNEDHFFGIAGHKMTLVGHDGAYTKPLVTEYIRIAPGQTMDVLVTTNQTAGCYYMAIAPYFDGGGPFTNTTASAILGYTDEDCTKTGAIPYPRLPAINNITAALDFTYAITSLNSEAHPAIVPRNITKNVLIEVGVANIGRQVASLNSISFVFPNISILEAYTKNISGYFDEDFPSRPEDIPNELEFGTKALMFDYLDEIEIVFQGGPGTHPLHIHGFTFYAVAAGDGVYKDRRRSVNYNLVDPPELNTVSVPRNGWIAVRFVADNPGVWYVHCHYEKHLTWGMSTVFIVRNGTKANETILDPPDEMPPCRCNDVTPCSSPISKKEDVTASLIRNFFIPYAWI